MKSAVREALEEVLEAEMEQALGAAKSERSSERLGYRSGYYTRGLVTRIGKIELRVPQDRQGRFRTEVFERDQRSEKALVSALAEMYIEGVSTRKVRKISEQLCGHSFSASAVSGVVKKLDRQLEAFAQRRRGLEGVELVVSDDHAGLRQAIEQVLAEAAWQRCYAHFLRNALDHLPRKADDDCLMELRWIYDRHDVTEARRDLARWLQKWDGTYSKLCTWVEENIEQTLTFLSLPRQHHKHMKSTNMLERLMEEIKRRTYVVRIFPQRGELLAAGAGADGGDA